MAYQPFHQPVLKSEVTRWLRAEFGGTFFDCTLGLGGHAEAILEASPEARVIGLDRDREALTVATQRLARFGGRFQGVQANFKDLAGVAGGVEIAKAQGILADLGVSSLQFDKPERGFSFQTDAPLDMRMDQSLDTSAADLIHHLSETELANLIFEYGEERGARRIARALVRTRTQQPIVSTKQLADLIVRALHVPGKWRIHPATRTFQALRIAVNDELRSLKAFIPEAITLLGEGGRLLIISFHSLEDRLVKHSFQRESGRCICAVESPQQASATRRQLRRIQQAEGLRREIERPMEPFCQHCGARRRVVVLTRKPISPDPAEIEQNPRSRSALLRVCEKLSASGNSPKSD